MNPESQRCGLAIEVKCRAKVNLFLRVLGRRQDGYHEVETIYHSIELHDILRLKVQKSDITLVCDHPLVPTDETNLASKAARRMLEGYRYGVRMMLEKRIPIAAGLGGGSADAAGALVGINKLYRMGLSLQDLEEHASALGADVKFMVRGGCAVGRGRGEDLDFLEPLNGIPVLLVVPDLAVSTKWAYASLKMGLTRPKANLTMLADTLRGGKIGQLKDLLYNDFESVVFERYPIVAQIRHKLLESGACASLMSGSGPVVFGVFLEEGDARRASKELASHGNRVIETAFATKGVTA